MQHFQAPYRGGVATIEPQQHMKDQNVTELLRAWGLGSRAAGEEIFPIVYEELRRIASGQANGDPQATMRATALVNEAFVEFARNPVQDWRDRAQFFAFAATVMRRLMVDYWRRRRAAKRGGSSLPVVFDELVHTPAGAELDIEALDEALTHLATLDATQARIVEMRFFGGMSVPETAQYLNISERTVQREWGMAKAWLSSRLGSVSPRP